MLSAAYAPAEGSQTERGSIAKELRCFYNRILGSNGLRLYRSSPPKEHSPAQRRLSMRNNT